jgi:cell division protein FtsA
MVLPIGGEQVSKEIAVQLRTPLAEAEALKVRHGDCRPSDIDVEEVIDAEIFGQGRSAKIGRRRLCEIIEDRSRQLIQQIDGEIKKLGTDAVLPAGLVLAGGVARTPGLAELASETLGLPARVGAPNNLSGLTDSITSPGYAAGVGLILWAAKQATSGLPAHQPGTASWQDRAIRDNTDTDVAGKFRTWLKAFLP